MTVSYDTSPKDDPNADVLEAMGAMPDKARPGAVLIVLVAALLLMTGTIIAGVPLVLKVGTMEMTRSVASRTYPQLAELRAYETDALGTAKKLDNGLFRIPVAAGKAALLANPSLLASAGVGVAAAPVAVAADAPAKSEEELVAEGKALFNGPKICMSCHKQDSADRLVGPGLKGIFGRVEKLADGTTVTVDEAYLIESLKEPNAKVVEGYPPAMTPQTFTDGELAALVAYLKTL
jgi:cytochrome c2